MEIKSSPFWGVGSRGFIAVIEKGGSLEKNDIAKKAYLNVEGEKSGKNMGILSCRQMNWANLLRIPAITSISSSEL